MKYKRQSRIIKIVKSTPIHTHEELIELLMREGFKVTQATVSRDIKELGLIKVPAPDGSSVYSIPETAPDTSAARIGMVADSIKTVTAALHTVVINTYPGMASAIAASLDSVMKDDILGSIAGDDTVLVITESPEAASGVCAKIRSLFRTDQTKAE